MLSLWHTVLQVFELHCVCAPCSFFHSTLHLCGWFLSLQVRLPGAAVHADPASLLLWFSFQC